MWYWVDINSLFQVEYRGTMWDSINELDIRMCRKFSQWLVNELPRKFIPVAQRLLDGLKDKRSVIFECEGESSPPPLLLPFHLLFLIRCSWSDRRRSRTNRQMVYVWWSEWESGKCTLQVLSAFPDCSLVRKCYIEEIFCRIARLDGKNNLMINYIQWWPMIFFYIFWFAVM